MRLGAQRLSFRSKQCQTAHQLGRLVSESACEREDPGSNPAADMVDADLKGRFDRLFFVTSVPGFPIMTGEPLVCRITALALVLSTFGVCVSLQTDVAPVAGWQGLQENHDKMMPTNGAPVTERMPRGVFVNNHYFDEMNISRDEETGAIINNNKITTHSERYRASSLLNDSQEDGSLFDDSAVQQDTIKYDGDRRHEELQVSPSSTMKDHWTRLKSILINMRGIIESEFPSSGTDEQFAFSILDKIISFGDNVEVIKRLGSIFDSNLTAFLGERWSEILENVVSASPVLNSILSIDTFDLTNSLMTPLLTGIGSLFKDKALVHLSDLTFVSNLMKSSGFEDVEIEEVFSLLGLTSDEENKDVLIEGRQYNSFAEKSGGYGHSGGGGGYGHGGGGGYMSHGGGGYMMQTIDPFVLLAGLAFASFLAFLLFRLLSQTTGRRRSIPDMNINLDLSDTPEVMTNLFNFLESAEKKIGINTTFDPIEKFGSSANTLWNTFQVDRLEKSCLRRFLCETVENPNSADTSGAETTLHQIAISALAMLLAATTLTSTANVTTINSIVS
ncbi:hypothetical protein FHG87_000096 [Trinorchestia longiramus]|nr:hypothetical protein FHG87_000096 [Trinorchestia longiramus]